MFPGRTIGAVGQSFFVEGTTGGSALTLTEDESYIFLGWYNPGDTPCLDSFQITLNTNLFDLQDLDFEKVNLENGDVIIELKEPFIVPPEEAFNIKSYYYRKGTDSTRPIGLHFREAKTLRNLASLLV